MGSQKTKTKSNETATTTPNLGAAAPLVNNYYAGLGALSPDALKTPANDLQSNLMQSGMGLLGQKGTDLLGGAIGATQGAMDMVNGAQGAGLSQAHTPGAYTPVNASAATAQAPGGYAPAQAQAANYGGLALASAPDMPTAAQANVAGIADGISAGGYGGARALTYYQDYLNPYTQQVVDTTMADLDQSQGADRAAYARRMASSGAFGGSRLGLGETNLIDAQGRTRAATGAQLRSNAFDAAMGYGAGDADRANSAGIASANNATQASIARAGLLGDAEMANVRAQNDFGLEGFRGLLDLNKSNAGFANDALRDIFGAQNDMSLANAGFANDALGRQYSMAGDMAQFNAGNQQQANLANAGAQNDALGQQYSVNADMSQFNAGQANQNAQFNAGMGLDRAQAMGGLAGQMGGLLGNAANYDLSKLGTLGDLAGQQQQIDLYNSPAGQAQLLAQLINGGGLLGAQSGQTITSNGTSTSKQSGGLGAALISGLAGLGSAAITKSERRVKRDIEKLGEEADGLGVYRFRYVWDRDGDPMRFGTMVDEVERLRPWALGPVIDGVRTVDYGAL